MVIGLSLTDNCWLFTGFEYWQILPSHHKTPHSVNYIGLEEAIALSSSVSTVYASNGLDHEPHFGDQERVVFYDSGFLTEA